jgi:hypothetical protein
VQLRLSWAHRMARLGWNQESRGGNASVVLARSEILSFHPKNDRVFKIMSLTRSLLGTVNEG